jgi:hypothetical protein
MKNKKFKYSVVVKYNLQCSYHFTSLKECSNWINVEYPKLVEKYSDLTLEIRKLDNLKIGDRVYVYGDGDCGEGDIIKDVIKYSDNRYGFLLDSGCVEEVDKCYKPK